MTELCPDSIRSDTSRHEITAAPEKKPGAGAVQPKPSGAFPVTSPRKPFLTSKRKDVGLRGLRTVCFRETGGPSRLNASRSRSSRTSAQTGAPDCFHSPTQPGPRAASPEPPRRSSRSAAPEVPSIDELPSRPAQAFTRAVRPGRAFSTSCCQAVENARRRFQAPPYPDSPDVPRAKKPASRPHGDRAEAQNPASWAAGLTPATAPATQLERARELAKSWGSLGADTQRSHRLLRLERSTA